MSELSKAKCKTILNDALSKQTERKREKERDIKKERDIEKERKKERKREREKERDIEKEIDIENAGQTDREREKKRKKDSMLKSGGPRKIKNLPNLHLLRICFLLLLNFVYTK